MSHDALAARNIVNEVRRTYNSYGQVATEWQSHAGAVSTSNTPRVQYSYADGSSNTLRPTGVTYPNGRVVGWSYGTAGTLGDLCSRVTEIKEGLAARVEYAYVGLSGVVTATYPEPGVAYTLVGTAGVSIRRRGMCIGGWTGSGGSRTRIGIGPVS